jgi:ABC-type sugar transport system permease subunit
VSKSPKIEEPWLILAVVSHPRASIEYLKHALLIDPDSPRAMRGMRWAQARLEKQLAQPAAAALVSVTQPALAVAPSVRVGPAPARRKASLGLTPAQRRNRLWGLALISPWLIGLLALKLFPILASFVLAFMYYPLLAPEQAEFISLTNFINIFKDPIAWSVLYQTISQALIIVPVQVGASVLLASVLNHKGLKMKNTMRSLFFLPSIIPATAAMYMFQGFFDPSTGWLNALILGPLGLARLAGVIDFSAVGGVRLLFIMTSLWSIGPGFLIMMSGLQAIPAEILEAAQIDGANQLQHFFGITVPMISPAIFFTIILNLTAVFGGSMLFNSGNVLSVEQSSYDGYIHYVLFELQRLGYASSLAWVFFILVMIIVLTLFVTSKRWVYFPDAERVS